MTEILWSALAHADLLDIIDYISEDNPVAALKVLDDINVKVSQLADFPKSGRLGRVEGTRELVVMANYVVVYREDRPTLYCEYCTAHNNGLEPLRYNMQKVH